MVAIFFLLVLTGAGGSGPLGPPETATGFLMVFSAQHAGWTGDRCTVEATTTTATTTTMTTTTTTPVLTTTTGGATVITMVIDGKGKVILF